MLFTAVQKFSPSLRDVSNLLMPQHAKHMHLVLTVGIVRLRLRCSCEVLLASMLQTDIRQTLNCTILYSSVANYLLLIQYQP